jgi:hypothetical protein
MILYELAEDPTNNHIVSWTAEGDGIFIKDCNKFEEFIIPKYFKHGKMSSFIRQLNMYYFKHYKNVGTNGKIYKQSKFIRGRKDLLCSIPHRMQEARRKAKQR